MLSNRTGILVLGDARMMNWRDCFNGIYRASNSILVLRGCCLKQRTDDLCRREAAALPVLDQLSCQSTLKLYQPFLLKLRHTVIAEGDGRQPDPVAGFGQIRFEADGAAQRFIRVRVPPL